MIGAARRTSQSKRDLPPLMNGDHLDQPTFHERYEAMPPDFRAELIGGIVYVSSPQKLPHGNHHVKLVRLADEYVDDTPGTGICLDSTTILGPGAEPQPDTAIFIHPECGGQATIDSREFLRGPPEWIGEISDSTEAIDLNAKKQDYEKAGVREYVVAALRSRQIFWFIRRRGKFRPLPPGDDGVIRSEVLPGLWLDPEAFLNRKSKRLFRVLRQGLASPEHAAFVQKLAAARSGRGRS